MGSAPSRAVEVKAAPKKVDAAAFAMTDDAGRVRDATNDRFEEGHQHTWQKSSSIRVIKANERTAAMRLAMIEMEQQEQEMVFLMMITVLQQDIMLTMDHIWY